MGEGIRACGILREELFVTTKLAAEAKDYGEAVKAIDGSLELLGLDYIDLMLIHAPQPWADFRGGDYIDGNRAAWRVLEEAYKAGELRSIGISNFKQEDIDNLLADCTVSPMVNQLLVHVSNTPLELIKYSRSKGVTVAQLCIRYCLQLDTLPLPKTASPAHMQENAAVDFVISDADMEQLKNMEHIKDYGEHIIFPVFSGK
ncbi:MAG: aldo/keto reductase [Eubacterium sp.]|nr:aldo/keto reductase [Eubacterium sp.]